MERRLGPDRRRYARGGRRPTDRAGFSPLVMVIESESARRDITEAILAKLHFAVVPVDSVDRAISITRALRPSVIVCSEGDAARVQEELPPEIAVVTITEDSEALLQSIRVALRARVIPIA